MDAESTLEEELAVSRSQRLFIGLSLALLSACVGVIETACRRNEAPALGWPDDMAAWKDQATLVSESWILEGEIAKVASTYNVKASADRVLLTLEPPFAPNYFHQPWHRYAGSVGSVTQIRRPLTTSIWTGRAEVDIGQQVPSEPGQGWTVIEIERRVPVSASSRYTKRKRREKLVMWDDPTCDLPAALQRDERMKAQSEDVPYYQRN
jgi:hypothetical protein